MPAIVAKALFEGLPRTKTAVIGTYVVETMPRELKGVCIAGDLAFCCETHAGDYLVGFCIRNVYALRQWIDMHKVVLGAFQKGVKLEYSKKMFIMRAKGSIKEFLPVGERKVVKIPLERVMILTKEESERLIKKEVVNNGDYYKVPKKPRKNFMLSIKTKEPVLALLGI